MADFLIINFFSLLSSGLVDILLTKVVCPSMLQKFVLLAGLQVTNGRHTFSFCKACELTSLHTLLSIPEIFYLVEFVESTLHDTLAPSAGGYTLQT